MTPRGELAARLKRARTGAGYRSQSALAKEMLQSRTQVTKAESASQPVPSDAVLSAWATATGDDEQELLDLAARCRSSSPLWFMPYLGAESQATLIRCYSPQIVPGLLETESYAREILGVYPHTPERLAELVRARVERRGVLDRGCFLVVALAEGVLSNCIGDAETMAEQVGFLVGIAQRPNVSVHVVPADTNHGCWAQLDIASHGANVTVNLSTALDDVPTTEPEQIDSAGRAWDRIMASARNAADSLDCLRTWEAQWKERI